MASNIALVGKLLAIHLHFMPILYLAKHCRRSHHRLTGICNTRLDNWTRLFLFPKKHRPCNHPNYQEGASKHRSKWNSSGLYSNTIAVGIPYSMHLRPGNNYTQFGFGNWIAHSHIPSDRQSSFRKFGRKQFVPQMPKKRPIRGRRWLYWRVLVSSSLLIWVKICW